MTDWKRTLAVYTDSRVLLILPLGIASGLPLLLTFSTLSAWLATAGISRSAIGAFALVGTPYAFKFLWSPLIDRLPPPIPIGRRRGWGITIQLALVVALLALGRCSPKGDLHLIGALAVLVAFLSASQDIVIDAYRVDLLDEDQQGPGAGMIQTGYRIGMLISGAGALIIAARASWFIAYATMAVLMGISMLIFLFAPEPSPQAAAKSQSIGNRWDNFQQWLATAVTGPFADFARRPWWAAILIFIPLYKLGEAMAGVMAMPLYVSLGFSLEQIAAVSKLFGFFATVIGALAGGLITAKLGVIRALVVCGILQSLGNLFYVLQAIGGHRLDYLALCVAAENLTGAMAGAALVAYLSDLCSPDFTATQYALLSSLAALGRTIIASSGGVLAAHFGWARFFLLTTVLTIPALLLLLWISRRSPIRDSPESSLAKSARG